MDKTSDVIAIPDILSGAPYATAWDSLVDVFGIDADLLEAKGAVPDGEEDTVLSGDDGTPWLPVDEDLCMEASSCERPDKGGSGVFITTRFL